MRPRAHVISLQDDLKHGSFTYLRTSAAKLIGIKSTRLYMGLELSDATRGEGAGALILALIARGPNAMPLAHCWK